MSVATTLKNVITPYLLRRSKHEVQHDISLPHKSEQVLFCSLTHEQRDLYKGYLMVCIEWKLISIYFYTEHILENKQSNNRKNI